MTGSVPEWLQQLWHIDPELAKIAKRDRDEIIEARYVAVSEISKIGRQLGAVEAQRAELLVLAKAVASEHPYGQRQHIVMDQLRAFIARAEKDKPGC